jgi:signal transduction histidine kinase
LPRRIVDIALMALLLAVGALQLTLPAAPDPRGFTAGGAVAALFLVLITLPLVVRRRYPLAVFALITTATLIAPIFHARDTSSEAVAHALALFTLVEVARPRTAVVAALVSLAVAWVHTQDITFFFYNAAFYGLVWSAGFFQGDRAAVQRELKGRADELERERERLRAAALRSERARISVELRRIVAAEVDAMAADIALARAALDAGADAAPRLAQLELRGREALSELRRLLVVLRRDTESDSADPSAAADGQAPEVESEPEARSPLLRWFATRRWATELLLFAGLGGGLALEIGNQAVPSTGTLAILSTSGAIVVLILRRRVPLLVLAAVGGVIVLQQLELQPPLTTTLLVTYMVAAYSVAVARPLAWSVLAIIGGAAAYAPHAPDVKSAAAIVLFSGAVTIFAVACGRSVRERGHLLAELSRRVSLLAVTRRRVAELAVFAERTRLAREMHDLVAHGVSVMVIQAGGAQSIAGRDPARASEMLARLSTIAQETRHETRLMLADLEGEGEAEEHPVDLESLGESLRAAGFDVAVRREGRPRPLPGALEVSIYRIAQEALTNVRKHAPGAAAEVRLAFRDDRVDLRIVNGPPRRPGERPEVPGGGHGLLGMRERVNLFGGVLRAEPVAAGGYAVHAEIPMASH